MNFPTNWATMHPFGQKQIWGSLEYLDEGVQPKVYFEIFTIAVS